MKTLIREANLTQREFSKRLDITERVISKWENGDSVPKIDLFVRMARELNIPLKRLCVAFGISVEGIPDDSPEEEPEDQQAT